MIYDLVKQDRKLANLYVYRPEPAKDKDLALVHTKEFLKDFFLSKSPKEPSIRSFHLRNKSFKVLF